MRISPERLATEAEATGFRPEILEKVIHLLELLEGIRDHPYIGTRLVLKGGTALNIFVFDLPRLSIDVDLNYVGSGERSVMIEERPQVEEALEAVLAQRGYAVVRRPNANEHAGGKWHLRYESAQGQGANLEMDLNYMYRVPIWPIETHDSRPVGSYGASQIPILNLHELAAGKLTALFARASGRDLFDTHQLMTKTTMDVSRLRTAFVVYGAMNRMDWREISLSDITFDPEELEGQLRPMLRRSALDDATLDNDWMTSLVDTTVSALESLLPFSQTEMEFLDQLMDHGRIVAELLTDDQALTDRIQRQPGLQWKAHNVREHIRD